MRLFWLRIRSRGWLAVVNTALAFIALLVIVVMVVVDLVSRPDAPVPFEPASLGNSQTNLANQGLVISAGEWVYYADPTSNYSVKRYRESDGRMENLAGIYGMYLNHDDEYLYYVDVLTDRLTRVRLTGAEIERLTKHTVSFAMLVDGQLIYAALDDAGVYTCRTDGTREQQLSTVRTQQLLALHDGLLFSDLSRAGAMGRMNRSNGSGLGHFDDRLGQVAVPFDNAVYFIDNRGSQRVYRADHTESGYQISDANIGLASGIATWGDALYFIGPENGGRLYRRQNQRDTQITDYAVFAPQICDGWLYVCRADEDGALYRIDMQSGDTVKLP